jgi:thiol-disulfide isomerase/thioredoxin
MPERLLLVLAIAALVLAAVKLARRWNARRIQRLQRHAPDWSSLGLEPDGRPTVIAFSTPSCAACHQAQRPALALMQRTLGTESVRVVSVDAAEQPQAARAFGILTVPATVVVAASGNSIVAVNQGFAPSTQLVAQLATAS